MSVSLQGKEERRKDDKEEEAQEEGKKWCCGIFKWKKISSENLFVIFYSFSYCCCYCCQLFICRFSHIKA
jgi:hypothetical protein